MGYTTKIPDAELLRGDPVIDGSEFDVETKSKVVEPEKKPAPTKSAAAKTKAK